MKNVKRFLFKFLSIVALSILIFAVPTFAQVGAGMSLGVGTRATAFAGNHVAVANDLSAVHWNPAALAFLPVREVQLTLDGMRFSGDTEIAGSGITIPPGATMSGFRDSARLSGLGAMTAIPTIQGGLTIAASFDRAYAFDNYTIFEFDGLVELRDEYGYDTITNIKLSENNYGDLNNWNGAFGVQIAPNLAAGLTLSLITGNRFFPRKHEIVWIDGETTETDEEYRTRYMGYALTVGLMYRVSDELSLAARFNPINHVSYKEEKKEGNATRYSSTADGRAYIAPSGVFGAGLTLPYLTAALDFRITMPQTFALDAKDADFMPSDMQASRFKFGAGLGVEVPIPTLPLVLRAGYSFDEYDLYHIIEKPNHLGINWNDSRWGHDYYPSHHYHTMSFGFATFTSGIGFELSYEYKTWGITTDDFWENNIRFERNYSNHRVVAGIIYRY